MPPPEPRSSTRSPSRSSATAVGLPQPREASTAASGSSCFSRRAVQLGADALLAAACGVAGRHDLASRGGVALADLLVDGGFGG